MIKAKSRDGGKQQRGQRDACISPCKARPGNTRFSKRLFIQRLVIRNDVYIQIRQFNQAVSQALFSRNGVLLMIDATHYDFCYAADASIFRNLHGGVRSIDRRNLRTQLLRETQIATQTLEVFAG